MDTLIKDPDSTVDIVFDWATWLQSGETISASEWEVTVEGAAVSPAELDFVVGTDTNTTSRTTVQLEGGEIGRVYEVRNRVTTTGLANPNIQDQMVLVLVEPL